MASSRSFPPADDARAPVVRAVATWLDALPATGGRGGVVGGFERVTGAVGVAVAVLVGVKVAVGVAVAVLVGVFG